MPNKNHQTQNKNEQNELPEAIKTIEYESVLEEITLFFKSLNENYEGLIVESDPINALLQLAAYLDINFENRINERYRQTLARFATGNNLDEKGRDRGILRLIIEDGDPNATPPKPTIYEDDEAYRKRVLAGPETYSVAGPRFAYEEMTKAVDASIIHARALAHTPEAGSVTIVILTKDEKASDELINRIYEALDSNVKVPMNDSIIVKNAVIESPKIEVTINLYQGENFSTIEQCVMRNLLKLNDRLLIGEPLTLYAIATACRHKGIQNMMIEMPKTDLSGGRDQAIRILEENVTINQGATYE